jgi:hypothetical protein
MTAAKSAIDIWRAFWSEGDQDGGLDDAATPTHEEIDALLAVASRLAPESLRLLMAAVRAAAPSVPVGEA